MLSVVIITFNESHNIERCLLSVKAVADEIIVLDSYSTDETCDISRKHGAKVIQRAWQGFSPSKNYANSLAQNDWILSLDADEALSEELQNSFLALKKQGLVTASFKRLPNYCGRWIRHGGWYPDIKLRLFNRQEMEWQGLVHEIPKSISNKSIKSILLKGDCYHYSYYHISEHYLQTENFATLSAQEMFKKGKKVNFIQLYISPSFKFFQMYLLKLGFLDGYYGFVIAKISARATYLKYYRLKQLQSATQTI